MRFREVERRFDTTNEVVKDKKAEKKIYKIKPETKMALEALFADDFCESDVS